MGYERTPQARLLFLHNRPCKFFERYGFVRLAAHPTGKGSARTAEGLTDQIVRPQMRLRGGGQPRLAASWSSPDHDEIYGTTGPVVIENADRHPSCPPGQGVQIGPAFVKQRAIRAIVVAMNDVKLAEAIRTSFRVALPQQNVFVLPIQRN